MIELLQSFYFDSFVFCFQDGSSTQCVDSHLILQIYHFICVGKKKIVRLFFFILVTLQLRVTQHASALCWVDFDFGSLAVPLVYPILLGLMRDRYNMPSNRAREV